MQKLAHIIQAALPLLFLGVWIGGCGSSQPTEQPPRQPTATIERVPEPTQQATQPSPTRSLSFADSGQRLGAARSWDVELGDLDADGDLDAFVANGSQSDPASAVWLNDGHAVFTISEQRLGYGVGIELGDLDGDGDLDAFITDWDKASEVWLNDGGVQGGTPGVFADSGQRLGSGGGFDAALGDLDGDGDLDAFVAQEKANTVWLNDGGGTFTDTGQALGLAITAAVALGDLDDDGDLDALAGGWDEPAQVWLNDGGVQGGTLGTFTDSGHDLSPASVHVHDLARGDVDGDGDLDVFLAIASAHPNQVWLNDGGVQGGTLGTFSDSGQRLPGSLAHGVSLGDLDGDGDLDAFVAHGDPWRGSSDTVWLNDGGVQGGTLGTFTDSSLRLGELASYAVGLGDLDNDGDLDAFVAHSDWEETREGVPNQVWLNETRDPLIGSGDGVIALTPTVAATPLPPASGDGAGTIAFVRTLEDSWGIYVMNTDGSDERRLIFDRQALAYPEWSPDGKRIAFHKHHSDAVWSINVMDADGGNEQRLTFTETQDAAPVWSPDGSRMVFSRGSDIWVMNADGSDQRLLMADPAYACCADWSPDGGRIAFESERDGNAEIYVMPAPGPQAQVDVDGDSPSARNAQRLTDDDAQDWWPAWSPDSTQIAFMSDRDGDWEIYVMDADGGNLRQLTDNEADDREPAWSPDGTRIAFHSNRDTGVPFDTEIYIMNSDGTRQQRVTQKAGMEWGIDWRPANNLAAAVPSSLASESVVPTATSAPATSVPATPTPATLTTDRKVQGWAILAQKDDYGDVGMTDLLVDYIGITQMRQVLESSGWKPQHIRELREFNRDTLQEGLDWLAENADQDDVVFLYVAAHGMYLRNVLVWDEFFADEWKQIPSHRRLLVIDSCQAANYTGVISGDPASYLSIAAVAGGEYGWSGLEEEGLPIIGGVFTHYFADAFGDPNADADGNGLISAQEAARLAEEQQRAYMHDVVFAVPEFLESYHGIGSFPDQDPSFPHVVVDDTVGAPLYLALDAYTSDEVASSLDDGGGVVAPSPTMEPTATATPSTAAPVPLPTLQTISVENAGQLIELDRLELPEMEDIHETCGVAFDPAGEKLAACCKSANVAVWDVPTGQRTYTLKAPTGICAHVAFSPDGQTLAAGGHRNVIPLWDTATGALVREIRRATANVSELAFSPIVTGSHAGLRLAVASFLGSALVWDLETDTRLAQFPLHYSRVNSLNFSPDGEMVVSGGGDNLARVWDASSGEPIIALEGPTLYVEDVEFNPEGTQVVGACDDFSIRIWDVGSGDLLHTLWHYGPVNGVTYSPDGKLLASASNDQTIGVWDASSGQSLIKLAGHSNLAIATAFHPDGTLIASVSWDGTVRLWGVPASTGASHPTLGDTRIRPTDGLTIAYVP